MSTPGTRSDESYSENKFIDYVLRILYVIRGSFSAFLFVLGIVSLLIGLIMGTGTMAGLLVIWGVSGMVYAVLLKAALTFLSFR